MSEAEEPFQNSGDETYTARFHIIERADTPLESRYRCLKVAGLCRPMLATLAEVEITDKENSTSYRGMDAVPDLAIVDFPDILFTKKPTANWLNADLSFLYHSAISLKRYHAAERILGRWIDVNLHSTHFVTGRRNNHYETTTADALYRSGTDLGPYVSNRVTPLTLGENRKHLTPAMLAVASKRGEMHALHKALAEQREHEKTPSNGSEGVWHDLHKAIAKKIDPAVLKEARRLSEDRLRAGRLLPPANQ